MTEPSNREWDDWQAAWRAAPERAAPSAVVVAELQRRLVRHRRTAWAYTVLDVFAAIVFVGAGVYMVRRSPTLPVAAWAAGVFAFCAIIAGFMIWNRRDALMFSAAPTADFVAMLRVRMARRERVPRFLVWVVAAEIAFGLVLYAIWSPGSIPIAAALYGGIVLVLAAWWWWYRARLRRERAQLDALCRDESGRNDSAEPA